MKSITFIRISEICVVRNPVCWHVCRLWFRGHELVELADACALWIKTDRLLASHWLDHPEQNSVRRIPRFGGPRRAPASWHERPMETADAGGTGKIPSRPS